MPKKHKVKSGETLSVIAKKYKIKDWKTIWEAPENKDLAKKRKKPESIQAGDTVMIPDASGGSSSSSSSKGKGGGQSEEDAVKQVSKHVSPKECFIWFMDSKRGYEPIPGTGCAHFVAHKKGWKGGKAGSNGCNKGYLTRVKDIATKCKSEVAPKDVAIGNVWINDKKDHTGLVSKVTAAKDGGDPMIEIEHSSSGQGKVAKNDWKKYFKGGGKFYKC